MTKILASKGSSLTKSIISQFSSKSSIVGICLHVRAAEFAGAPTGGGGWSVVGKDGVAVPGVDRVVYYTPCTVLQLAGAAPG